MFLVGISKKEDENVINSLCFLDNLQNFLDIFEETEFFYVEFVVFDVQ